MASYETRGKTTRVVVSLGGGKRITATFDTLREAREWGNKHEKKKKLVGSSYKESARVTNGELWELYESKIIPDVDSARANSLRFSRWYSDPLAKVKVIETTTDHINDWITRRSATPAQRGGKLKPSTINRELNLMSGAFTYAVKGLRWIPINPCHGCNRPEVGKPRKVQLRTPDEIAAIKVSTGYDMDPRLETLTARTGACFLLSLETGMRSGEILRLRPEDYWRDKRTAYVSALERGGRKSSQSGRASTDPSRKVPLTGRAMEILDQLMISRPEGQPYIVGLSDRQRDALWRKARKMAGVKDLHFHDAKHEAATRLAKFLDPIALSHAIGTKDLRLLRDTYYINDASISAARLPAFLATEKDPGRGPG